jgi:hypothetical protein
MYPESPAKHIVLKYLIDESNTTSSKQILSKTIAKTKVVCLG